MKKSIVTRLFVFVVMVCLVENAMAKISTEIIRKTQTCAACHGAEGISANPEWPNLAGQHASFLRKQLLDFKEGKNRNATIMAGIAASLSEKDIRLLAEYYASLPRGVGKTSPKYQVLGEKIYRGACIACHGPQGGGNDEALFPVLAGQQALYTIQQLHAFKDKTRRNDLNHIMQDICARMSQKDMAAAAYYMQGMG